MPTTVRARTATAILLSGIVAACSSIPVTDTPPVEIGGRPNVEIPIEFQSQPCATCVWAVHDPLFATSTDSELLESTITVRATTESDGLTSLVLNLTTGNIVPCTSLQPTLGPSAVPCSDNAVQTTINCLEDPGETDIECTYSFETNQASLVSYQAVATDALGMSRSTPTITYAYGEPPHGKARPIWWHSADAGNAAMLDRIELGFFPHPDYESEQKTYSDFAEHVNDMIGAAFFNDEQEYSDRYTANRHIFDLWAAPLGATAPFDCVSAYGYDAATQPARQLTDAGIIVHYRSWRDCSHIEDPPGDGTVYGRSSDNGYLVVHESGHFLLGLGDEYERLQHMACSNPPNVYLSKEDCEQVAGDIGANADACTPFQASGMWRIDEPNGSDGLLEIMDDEGGQKKSSAFQKSSGDALDKLFQSCLNGSCYTLEHECVGPAEADPGR